MGFLDIFNNDEKEEELREYKECVQRQMQAFLNYVCEKQGFDISYRLSDKGVIEGQAYNKQQRRSQNTGRFVKVKGRAYKY